MSNKMGFSARFYRRHTCALTVLLALFSFVVSAPGDLVTDWNTVLLNAIRAETTAPCLASRNLAILHVAIYDSANAIDKSHESFQFRGQAPSEVRSEERRVGKESRYRR